MRVFPSAVVAAALSVSMTTVSVADTGDELFKLLPGDGEAGDEFGRCVSISGAIAVVGAHLDDDNGPDSGSAYLFDTTTGQQIAKLLPNDGAAGDWFGESVHISGTTAIVGARYDDDNGDNSGSAYLFDATTGQQVAKLLPNDGAAKDWFGYALAISGTTAVVAAELDDDNGKDSGSAYIFDTTTGQQIAKLLPADGATDDWFGESVGISGTTAIVGTGRDDDIAAESGSAYLFDTTTGQQIAKLLPNDGAASDFFGFSANVNGATAIVGAPWDDDNGDVSGSAYLFDTTTGQQFAKLLPSDGSNLDVFGHQADITGAIAIVGASQTFKASPGAAYLFDINSGHQVAKLVASDGTAYDKFGHYVAISGGTAIVGAHGNDGNSGSAYLFDAKFFGLDSIDITRTRYDQVTGVTLTGSGFSFGGATTVLFDATPATNIVVVDDTTITCDTPIVAPGQFDVDVTVTNDNGTGTLVDVFTFTPALQLSGNWVVGGDLTLTYLLDPQDSIFAIYGLPPVLGIDTPPFDGQLCIVPFYTFFILTGWPTDNLELSYGIPNNPNLSGLDVLFQGLIGPSFGNPKDAAWTNCGVVDIQ